ncbi:hypothetical protein QBC43DRAFT_317670 [Cladorrhinum sp. PSN259]|nr:hypothetical protein QBC43DRAFT_317670 [Cladorrhinum sp. PSN259]
MVMVLFFRMYFRRDEQQQDEGDGEQQAQRTELIMDREATEKPAGKKPRNWPLICLTTVRVCQLVFSIFTYLLFLAFIDTSEIWLDRSSQEDRDAYATNVPWVRMLNSVNLMYHISALVLLYLWKKTEASKWRYFAMTTIIGDLLSLWMFLYALSLMYSTYQGYCYLYPRVFDYEKDGFLTYFGKSVPPLLYRDLQIQRHVICAFLDGMYWLSLIPSLSHLLSILNTTWYYKRAKRIESIEFETFEKIRDLEQAVAIHPPSVEPAAHAGPSGASTPPHSPPPSYRSRSGSSATSVRPPSYRRVSMETTSSVDPDTFLVSDGWRGPDQQPPEYSSRPPSLRKEQP